MVSIEDSLALATLGVTGGMRESIPEEYGRRAAKGLRENGCLWTFAQLML